MYGKFSMKIVDMVFEGEENYPDSDCEGYFIHEMRYQVMGQVGYRMFSLE